MVGIAQLVSASDCGSDGPGFESLYPPFRMRNGLSSLRIYFISNEPCRKRQFSGCVLARHRGKMAFSIGRMPYNEQTVAKQLQFA